MIGAIGVICLLLALGFFVIMLLVYLVQCILDLFYEGDWIFAIIIILIAVGAVLLGLDAILTEGVPQ
jgi:hypothetical protein